MGLVKDKRQILKYVLFAAFLIMLVLLVSTNPVLADVGNNNRYEDSGSLSSGGDDSGDGFFLIYLLFEIFGPVPGLIVLAIGFFIYIKLKKSGKLGQIKSNLEQASRTTSGNVSNFGPVNNTEQVATKIRNIDPAFSEDKFIGWAREVFIKIQQAWSARDWKVIRPFESNELFSQHATQLQEYINNNKINVIEKINVNYCQLRSFTQDGDKEVLEVELHAIMRDYVIDATTRKVLESDPNKDWHMKYIMTFNRKAGVRTNPGTSNKSTTNCPNCGAPTTITSAGQCEYCGSVITTGEHDWVLSDIRGIR